VAPRNTGSTANSSVHHSRKYSAIPRGRLISIRSHPV
jgi:hypothetical protein